MINNGRFVHLNESCRALREGYLIMILDFAITVNIELGQVQSCSSLYFFERNSTFPLLIRILPKIINKIILYQVFSQVLLLPSKLSLGDDMKLSSTFSHQNFGLQLSSRIFKVSCNRTYIQDTLYIRSALGCAIALIISRPRPCPAFARPRSGWLSAEPRQKVAQHLHENRLLENRSRALKNFGGAACRTEDKTKMTMWRDNGREEIPQPVCQYGT